MAAALEAVKPLSITFLSACGNASIAAAATMRASRAMNMRPRYGRRNGSSARSGRSERAFGRSDEGRSDEGLSEVVRAFTELESAQVQFPPHAEIAGETVQRMAKGRGPVALEVEMPHPREAVATEQRGQQPPEIAGADQAQHADDRAPGSDVVQRARDGVSMFAEIKGIELRKAAETRILGGADAIVHRPASSGTLQPFRNPCDARQQAFEQVAVLPPRLPP